MPILLVALQTTHALLPLVRSVSSSRQFIIYGTDARLRGVLCEVAEREKSALLALLKQGDNWKTPIVVNAQHPQANLPEMPTALLRFSQTGTGLKFQLDLTIPVDVSIPAIEREFLRVVLLEMMYRNQPNLPAGTSYVQPPAWLLDGVLASAGQRDPVRFSGLLKGLVAAKRVISLGEFLRQRPELLDSPSREVYRAYCFVLMMVLTDSPGGRSSLARFIVDFPNAPHDSLEDLRAHFTVFGASPQSTEKTWRSNVARLASLEGFQPLTVAESERQLDNLLHLQFPNTPQPLKPWNLEDYSAFIRLRERAVVLKRLGEDLMRLGTRAHPVYRSIIFEYQRIAILLAHGKTLGISRRLTPLRHSREALVKRMVQIDDYMNWFEATQSRTHSGKFAEYLKAADKPAGTKIHRRDPISIYLDALESQFSN